MNKVYEIGYLITPSVSSDKKNEIVEALEGAILSNGAVMISKETAEIIPLAYDVTKNIQSKNLKYGEAYFGWFKFEIDSTKIASVKKVFDNTSDILRFLLITTIKENTYLGKKVAFNELSKETKPDVAPENPSLFQVPEAEIATTEVLPKVTIEEMDKSIDDLVKEA